MELELERFRQCGRQVEAAEPEVEAVAEAEAKERAEQLGAECEAAGEKGSINQSSSELQQLARALTERFAFEDQQANAQQQQQQQQAKQQPHQAEQQQHLQAAGEARKDNKSELETAVAAAAGELVLENNMSEREGTPTLISDPLLTGTNRATTTERRTTTTTTTKRTIKSSDDFIPTATDIQQVRSESRTGSISSTSSPIFSTTGGPINQQQQQQQQLINDNMSNSGQQQATTSSSSSTTRTTTSSSSKQEAASGTTGGNKWNDSGLQSPLIQDTEEGRVLKLRFDVTQYEPEEIVVKTVDNRLTVHAKHEERSENKTVYREYNREFHLPDGTDVEQIRSSLSKDGVLTVDCPLPTPQLHGASRRIPIEKV